MTKSTCEVAECDRPRRKRQWCNGHYQRFLDGRAIGGPLRRFTPGAECSAPGCVRPHKCHGLCEMHADRVGRNGSLAKVSRALDASPSWVGDDVTYNGMHHRLKSMLGSARLYGCVECGLTARDWAYDHTDPNEATEDGTGYPYSTDPDRYAPMCRSCHIRFDRAS